MKIKRWVSSDTPDTKLWRYDLDGNLIKTYDLPNKTDYFIFFSYPIYVSDSKIFFATSRGFDDNIYGSLLLFNGLDGTYEILYNATTGSCYAILLKGYLYFSSICLLYTSPSPRDRG